MNDKQQHEDLKLIFQTQCLMLQRIQALWRALDDQNMVVATDILHGTQDMTARIAYVMEKFFDEDEKKELWAAISKTSGVKVSSVSTPISTMFQLGPSE